ncbi:hypothetical protein KI797_11590 [Aeromonas media]|uniref:hypothetical protein n=1 Tax=Aeromonas media TaxID=651 RepID=UPI001CF45065|nr:hypothetical protein [Aeromonas media]UCP13332.1 hypothetical protein KI797_11590 [Aeromonas media]
MPEANQSVMEAIRDEAIAIATKAQAQGNKELLRALATVPTQFDGLTKEIERIDAEILGVKSDQLKRPKHGPDMPKMVSFAKRIGKVHASDLLAECGDDLGALLALLEVVKGGDEHWAGVVQGRLTNLLLITHDPQPASRADMASEGLPRLHAPIQPTCS